MQQASNDHKPTIMLTINAQLIHPLGVLNKASLCNQPRLMTTSLPFLGSLDSRATHPIDQHFIVVSLSLPEIGGAYSERYLRIHPQTKLCLMFQNPRVHTSPCVLRAFRQQPLKILPIVPWGNGAAAGEWRLLKQVPFKLLR